MIDTKEMRLGNMVLDKHGKTARVTEIGLTGIKVDGGPGSYRQYAGEFSPIEITDELLAKIGFERSEDVIGNFNYDRIWKLQVLEIVWIMNADCYKTVDRCEDRIGRLQIKWIHQLQNLYYALTGKELKESIEIYE